tara:strand:+ start:169 stop:405 length:237 start_codon:yes stop_codon:yes gene_type:complete
LYGYPNQYVCTHEVDTYDQHLHWKRQAEVYHSPQNPGPTVDPNTMTLAKTAFIALMWRVPGLLEGFELRRASWPLSLS